MLSRQFQGVDTAYKNKQRNQREKQGKFIQCVSIEESVRNNPNLKLKEGSSKQVDLVK